jgi:hypothetical protein
MKILHLYGLSGMLLLIGVLLYWLQSALLYLAWYAVACGSAAALIGLFRLFIPAYIQASGARHEQWKAAVDLELRERVVAYAERRGMEVQFEASGTIAANYPARSVPPAVAKDFEPEEQAEQVIPSSVRYEDICNQIPRGHGLLGVSANSVETADFQEFMTMLISGGSNSGKSNTVGLKLHEAIENGRDIRLLAIDWHWRKADSLYNKIKCYEERFLMPVVTSEEGTLTVLQWFYDEFKRRLECGVSEDESDILLVVDEVPAIMDAEDEQVSKLLKRIALKCGREARGFGMYGWFITQQVIGLAWLRNVVHTNIAHKATRINEAGIACNDHKDIARDMENWPRGRVIVYGQNFTGVRVLQMPIFVPHSSTVPDQHRNAFSWLTEPLEEDIHPVPGVPEISALEREKISSEERERILELAKSGIPRREMCQALGKGKWYYETIKIVLDQEGL